MLNDIKEAIKSVFVGIILYFKTMPRWHRVFIITSIVTGMIWFAYNTIAIGIIEAKSEQYKYFDILENQIQTLEDKVIELERELEVANKEIDDISKTKVEVEDKTTVQPTPVQKEEPVSSSEDTIKEYVSEISKKYGMPEALINSIIWHESRFNPNATNGGCVGLMQICTRWHGPRAQRLGVTNFYDPYGSILIGVDYIHELYKNNGNDYGLALMLYNMDHKSAYELHRNGQLSKYATSVLARANLN